ncbi:RNA pseudouridine synthase [Permianibacter sp. IMCC34836]|uniref:pseudouridine synthase n=1 Tax=Permianibacter fluminis TaxID=2738515 RepID=UPI001554B742|nr:pseudouridine synthase [Permianibacter fluminis]NQD35521.1 RNA pseudouridine synthase [Permianibacter fluminis]
MSTQEFQIHITEPGQIAVDVLAARSGLPKARIKDAMAKGAVWLKQRGKEKRLRRVSTELLPGDTISLYYDARLLALTPPTPIKLADETQYSVWLKPAGVLAQGTREGDHCAMLRLAELALNRQAFLVHRLDREASGLMLIAHTGKAAAALSALFAEHTAGASVIEKRYRVEVRGELPSAGQIDQPLDGKAASTRFTRLSFDAERQCSIAEVVIDSGRKHQIRRHLAGIGHPVLGDPQYGEHNADPRGLQLFAVQLKFVCPLSKRPRDYRYQP